ncbi:MAG: PAS domain-containing protein, partial [Janthinobacterium lividum]
MDGADAAWDVRGRAHAGLILDAMDQAGNIVAVLEVADVACGLRVITANTALSRALGRSVAEIEGSPADFLAGDDADPARLARLRDALRLGEPLQETIGVQVEGRQVWIGLRLMPAGSETSVPRRFVLLGRDISERRRRADADGAMQVLLGQAFRQAGIAMAVVETGGTIVMSNQQFHTLCGRPASAIDGRNFTRQLHLDDIPETVARRERQTVDGQSYDMTVRLVRPDGGVVPVQLHCNLLENRTLRRLRIVTLTPVPSAAAPGVPAPEPGPEPASRPVVLAGGISLVGLEGVRNALGDRWPAVAQRVVASAEHVLRRHLLPDESFSRQSNGTGFVVCFSGADARRSELRAAAITREIRTRLIGEMDDAGLAATTLALDPQPITQAELAEPAGTLSGLLEQRLKRRRGALEDQARAALAEAAATARCLLVPATTPAGVPVPL